MSLPPNRFGQYKLLNLQTDVAGQQSTRYITTELKFAVDFIGLGRSMAGQTILRVDQKSLSNCLQSDEKHKQTNTPET